MPMGDGQKRLTHICGLTRLEWPTMPAMKQWEPTAHHLQPVEKFSSSDIQPNSKHWQPFGCPVCVLVEALQSDTVAAIHHKWKDRSRVGVHLGRSPQHARNVVLVLNPETGHFSPQFHVVFDPSFQTIKRSFGGNPPESLWKTKCGFDDNDKPVNKPKC